MMDCFLLIARGTLKLHPIIIKLNTGSFGSLDFFIHICYTINTGGRNGANLPAKNKYPRECPNCKSKKDIDEYYRKLKGVSYYCKECTKEIRRAFNATREGQLKNQKANRQYKKKHPDFAREHHLLHNYKINLEQFGVIFESQGCKCLACGAISPGGKYKQWHIDHDHKCCPTHETCGKCVRGILCSQCNRTLGNCNDNINRLTSLIVYLENCEKHPTRNVR